MDLGQGDDRLPGTDRMLTDVAGIKLSGYKSKLSDRTLTGATLEMEILSQCGESTMKDFKPSPMNHGKGSVFENNADALETTEPANESYSTLELPSVFAEMKRDLPESSSPGNSKDNEQKVLMESPRRRRIESAARVPFLGTLPEEE